MFCVICCYFGASVTDEENIWTQTGHVFLFTEDCYNFVSYKNWHALIMLMVDGALQD